MKYKLLFLLLCAVVCLINRAYSQKTEIFAPKGAVWFYENEGQDTTVKWIKIVRGGFKSYPPDTLDATFPEYCRYYHHPVIDVNYLNKDSVVVGVRQVVFDTLPFSIYYHNLGSYCESKLYSFSRAINNSDYIEPLNTSSMYGPLYKWFFSFKDSITINGKRLMMVQKSADSISDNARCVTFCSPMIERIGSLGYMFPIDVCQKNFYGGRLISYYDPEFGYWKVPDSLRGLVCSYKYVNVGIDPFKINKGYKISPNPTTDNLRIETYSPEATMDFELYNYSGQKLYFGILPPNTYCTEISTANYPAGLYFLRLKSGNDWKTEKIELLR